MNPQTKTLFHKNDPETSREAAEKMVESGKLNRQEKLIIKEIKEIWPNANWTAAELARETLEVDLDYYTIQRRLSGLYRKGKIERTGEKRDGCCVWRLIKER